MTPVELQKAFAAVGPAEIRVPAGVYPPMTLKGNDKTLIADGDVVFRRLRIGGSRNTVKGLSFDAAPTAAEPFYTPVGLLLISCTDTVVDGCTFIGGMLDKGVGLLANDCVGLTVSNCKSNVLFQHLNITRGRNVTLSGNSLRGVGENGISIAGCDGIAIRGNRMTDFTAQGDAHPDAIQLWTAWNKGNWYPVHNVVIDGNVLLQGTGTGMQGIFHRSRVLVKAGEAVADELTRCKNWRITRNTVYQWGQWHGISLIEGVDNVSIVDNACLSPDDDTKRCWINLDACNGVSLVRNVADDYIGKSMPADWATWGNVKTAKVAAMISDLNARASASALRI